MRKRIFGCVAVLIFGALLSGGCAKKDVVKSEQPLPAVQTTVPPAAQPEVARPMPAERLEPRAEPIAETPTGETTIAQETAREGMRGSADLQSELQEIYFNFDSADLSEESRSILSKNAQVLARQAAVKLRVEGHCDERGSDEYNMALGERRAKAAKDYLVNLGVQPERISVISYGEEKPAEQGQDEEAWAKNRRAEFVIVK